MIVTLIVEDEQIAAQAHAAYLALLPGFSLAGVARSGREALVMLRDQPIDLVLLDISLPDGNGLDIVRRMRAAGHRADVLAVTANRELDAVRRAVNLGIVGYLLKPFTRTTFTAKLEHYADYRRRFAASTVHSQADVDRLLGGVVGRVTLPTGLTVETLESVTRLLEDGTDLSASEVADAVGTSRATARRYLEYLADTGVVSRKPRYGSPGRPSVAYQRRRF
jgi:response regulator of citrate/malate metabolism